MLFWRTGSSLAITEPECGVDVGNQGFFTNGLNQAPVATNRYTDFLSRGWKVLGPENYLLPANVTNPCN